MDGGRRRPRGSPAAGEAALDRRAWPEALSAFWRALASGADPGALEGLAEAAFFLDDGPLVFEHTDRPRLQHGSTSAHGETERPAVGVAPPPSERI